MIGLQLENVAIANALNLRPPDAAPVLIGLRFNYDANTKYQLVASWCVDGGGAHLSVGLCRRRSSDHVQVRVCSCCRVVNRYLCAIVTVYRPGSESVQSVFFDELADLLDAVATLAESVWWASLGDLNIRLDRADDANAVRLVDLLSGYVLNIQVSVSTHQLGSLLM